MKMRSCMSLVVAAMLAASASAASGDDGTIKSSAVALSEVRTFPEAYRRVPFELELLYHGPRSVYNPFFTIFEPSNWANFAAWPGDAAIFRRDAYVEDHPFFYVERRAEELQRALMALKPYTWFSATCIVRSTAQGRAWIEVLALKSVGASLEPSDLRHLVRAQSLSSNGDFDRSLVEHGLARLLNAPPRFVARCRLEEGRVALAANQPDRALLALQQAWPQLQDDKQLAALLDRASAQVALRRDDEIASVPTATPEKPAPSVKPQPNAPVTPIAAPKPQDGTPAAEPEMAPKEPPPQTPKADEPTTAPAAGDVPPTTPVETPAANPPVDAPAKDTPVTEPPVADTPVTEPPATDAPATDAPKTDAPKTEEQPATPPAGEPDEPLPPTPSDEGGEVDPGTEAPVDDLPIDGDQDHSDGG